MGKSNRKAALARVIPRHEKLVIQIGGLVKLDLLRAAEQLEISLGEYVRGILTEHVRLGRKIEAALETMLQREKKQ